MKVTLTRMVIQVTPAINDRFLVEVDMVIDNRKPVNFKLPTTYHTEREAMVIALREIAKAIDERVAGTMSEKPIFKRLWEGN
jgi:hypothetical protein